MGLAMAERGAHASSPFVQDLLERPASSQGPTPFLGGVRPLGAPRKSCNPPPSLAAPFHVTAPSSKRHRSRGNEF